MSKNDISYVAKIMQQRWDVSKKYALEETSKYLAMDNMYAGFCVYHKEKVIGVGLFSLYNEDVSTEYGPWVYLLWIEPKFRGNNLGIELTKRRMEHAKKHNYITLYLDTMDASLYHRALGWQDVAIVRYENDPTLIMKWDLSKDFPI